MGNSGKIAIIALFASAVVDLTVLRFDTEGAYGFVPVFSYLLILLIAIAYTCFLELKAEPGLAYRSLANRSLRTSSLYALFIAIFTYIYYNYIDPLYLPGRIEAVIKNAQEHGATAEQIANQKETAEMIFDPLFHSTLTLFGFMLLGVVYSLIVAAVVRRMPR